MIEDAAHAFGVRFTTNKPVGSSGDITCFSFYANKNLSTGEGGAIALTDRSMAEEICSLHQPALVGALAPFSPGTLSEHLLRILDECGNALPL